MPDESQKLQQIAEHAADKLHSAGQRRVNLIWETMQAFIAGSVVATALFIAARLAMLILEPTANVEQTGVAGRAFMLLSNLVSLIIGFYFGRTNHQRTGGVSREEDTR